MHGTTFGGGPLACAVAVEVVKTVKSLLGHVNRVGKKFRSDLEGLRGKHACVREIRGLGLMLAMELDSADKAKAVVKELLQQGILINRTHETVLRFLPPYIVEEKHVKQVVRALDAALQAAA
jgi:acetylornithine aminotransferase/acetylornithine/N-succinyldiaminopimelate aminotransferase